MHLALNPPTKSRPNQTRSVRHELEIFYWTDGIYPSSIDIASSGGHSIVNYAKCQTIQNAFLTRLTMDHRQPRKKYEIIIKRSQKPTVREKIGE